MKKLITAVILAFSLVGLSTPAIAGAAAVNSNSVAQPSSANSTVSIQSASARLLMWTDGVTYHYVTVNYVPPIRLVEKFQSGNKTVYVYEDAHKVRYFDFP